MIALELRGVRTRCLPMWSSSPRLFRLSFGDSDLKKANVVWVEEALTLSLHGEVSVCPRAFSYRSHYCVIVIY